MPTSTSQRHVRPALAVVAAAAAMSATQLAAGGVPTAVASQQSSTREAASGHLDLGPAGLSEQRTTTRVQPGVTLTRITRGTRDPSVPWTLEVLIPSTRTSPDPDAPARVLSDRASAQAEADRLRAKGFDARVETVTQPAVADVPTGTLGYRVRVGSFPTKEDADTAKARLAASGESANSVYTGWDGDSGAPGPWHVDVVRIDPRRFRGTLDASYGHDLYTRETTSQMSVSEGADIGVNGGFFVLDPSSGAPGDPAGAGVYDGKVLSEPVGDRPALVLRGDAAGTRVQRLSWRGNVVLEGRSVPLDGVDRVPGLVRNCGGDPTDEPTDLPLHDVTCTDDSELVAFTPQYGETTPTGTGTEVVLDSRGVVRSVSAGRGTALPPGTMSVQGTGPLADRLGRLHVGDRLPVRWRLVTADGDPLATPRDSAVVSGGPLLVRHGQEEITQRQDGFVHPDDPSFAYGWVVQRNPRTFAGVDAQGRTVLVTVDGRSENALGVSIPEAADVARSLGLVDAVNLDGGGSTTMTLHDRVISHPSDSTGERAVGDALLVLPGSG